MATKAKITKMLIEQGIPETEICFNNGIVRLTSVPYSTAECDTKDFSIEGAMWLKECYDFEKERLTGAYDFYPKQY